MSEALRELQALTNRIGRRVPTFCNPVPSREDWNRIEKLIETLTENEGEK